jgi:hypothetical protein
MQMCFCNIHPSSIRVKVGEDGDGDNDSGVMMRAVLVMTLIMTMLV